VELAKEILANREFQQHLAEKDPAQTSLIEALQFIKCKG
jgi:hypothetical protein